MAYLLDTGILLRLVDTKDRFHESVSQAIATLAAQNQELFITTQNIAEFWNVATRPTADNGLGLSVGVVVKLIEGIIEPICGMLVEGEMLYHEFKQFKRLGSKYAFGGKQARDARLVAMMISWGIDRILTLNERDFRPYTSEGIAVVVPSSLTH